MTSYVINKTDGTVLTTVYDGTTDTTTDLVLLGKNYTAYGEFVAENFVKLMENFANNTAPPKPLTGQLWYCKDATSASSGLNVYDGTRFVPLPRFFKAVTAPASAIDGDLWWHRTDKQLFGYNGTVWVLIGPTSKASQNKTGIYAEDIYDTGDTLHTVLSLYVKDSRIYISSRDAEFTPAANANATGYATIKPGINSNTSVQTGDIRFAGIATGADNATTVGVSELTESQLMRKDITQTMAQGLIIGDSTVGLTLTGALSATSDGASINLRNLSASKNLNIQNSANTNAITVHQSSSYVGIFKSNPTKALDVTGDSAITGSLTAASGTLIANATGVYANGGNTWTQSTLTNLNQLTNGPGYLVAADFTGANVVSALGYSPARQTGISDVTFRWNGAGTTPGVDIQLSANSNTTIIGNVAFTSYIANNFIGATKDVWQKSTDGRNRVLFSDNSATIFGSHTSTYIWKDTSNVTIATLTSNGNLNLDGGTAWTTSTGPNPLSNVSQLTNDLNFISQDGSTTNNVKFRWNTANLEAYSDATNSGAVAFKSEVASSYLGRTVGVWQTSSDGNNRFYFNSNSSTVFGSKNGYVWKRSDSTANAATLSETGVFTATNDIVAFSDAKLKTNVYTIEHALNTVQSLRGVTFTRVDDNRNSLGVIAQEVQKVLPEVVNDTDGTLGVAYGNMVGLLIEAIKEQQIQINDLQNQINELKAK